MFWGFFSVALPTHIASGFPLHSMSRAAPSLSWFCLVCLLICGPCFAAIPTSNYGNLTLVADGYVWIENIFFDNRGALFFSDSFRGEVVRVTVSTNGSGTFEQQLWLSGFYRVLGFTLNQEKTEMYAVAWFTSSEYSIIAFNTSVPGVWRTVASTELGGNGLGLDTATNTLYTASEGEFIPTEGVVFSMNMTGVVGNSTPQAAPVRFDFGLTAADGLWVDNDARILYVSEVLNATVRRYDLTHATPQGGRAALISTYEAPGMIMLDDFSVATDLCTSGTATMFGADFWAGKVIAFPADGSSGNTSTELVSGLYNPTSVRPGRGAGFDDGRTLFISEGGGIDVFMNNRRLWKLSLDDRCSC